MVNGSWDSGSERSAAEDGAGPRHRWATTEWGLVCQAAERGQAAARAADALCQAYWFPVYAFLRQVGTGPLEAHDVTQGFFLSLLDSNSLLAVDPNRGRFRSWLRSAAHNYLKNQLKRARAESKGGKAVSFSLDAETAEARYQREPRCSKLSPDQVFDRCFAGRVIERAVARLRQQYAERGEAELFQQLASNLGATDESLTDAQLGLLLGKSAGAIKQARFHQRAQFGQLAQALKLCIREEVANTVLSPLRVDAELRALLEVLNDEPA